MMGNDDGNPILHDFLGMSCADSAAVLVKKSAGFGEIRASEASASASVGVSSGAHGPVSASSDLVSERQTRNHLEGVQFHSSKSDFSATEMSNRSLGRKRSNSDSAFMGLTRDRMHHMGMDSVENSHLLKMFQNEAGGERQKRSHDDELFFSMQPPRPTCTSPLIFPPAINGRPELVVSSWERSMPMNAGPMVHYPSCLGQFSAYVDPRSSSRYRDTTHASTSSSLVSQPAADEGSRTGIRGSSIVNVIGGSSVVADRNPAGVLLSSSRPKVGPSNSETESANPLSRSLRSTSRQMTIFYAGQAHVFDDVHPNKADEIMALAGSNGGSWSTTYSPKSSMRRPHTEAYVPAREIEAGIKNKFSQDIQSKLCLLQASSQGLIQGGQLSTPGGNQTGRPVRDAGTIGQAVGPDTGAKERYGGRLEKKKRKKDGGLVTVR
ncbi:protein TIFY 8 isoform X2 [Magnolia sinica]|uniref:protein TIFY 8 isoform X2 n=1 Tax=Magnolia sinica TaxID=86752 RepID=UPI002658FE52|nr:protein TIFY 8 isoform X2 [Magnolia sinica]